MSSQDQQFTVPVITTECPDGTNKFLIKPSSVFDPKHRELLHSTAAPSEWDDRVGSLESALKSLEDTKEGSFSSITDKIADLRQIWAKLLVLNTEAASIDPTIIHSQGDLAGAEICLTSLDGAAKAVTSFLEEFQTEKAESSTRGFLTSQSNFDQSDIVSILKIMTLHLGELDDHFQAVWTGIKELSMRLTIYGKDYEYLPEDGHGLPEYGESGQTGE